MKTYKRHRFPPEIISYAVWLYFRFNLSHRDVEDLLSERGVIVSYESIRLWSIKFVLNILVCRDETILDLGTHLKAIR